MTINHTQEKISDLLKKYCKSDTLQDKIKQIINHENLQRVLVKCHDISTIHQNNSIQLQIEGQIDTVTVRLIFDITEDPVELMHRKSNLIHYVEVYNEEHHVGMFNRFQIPKKFEINQFLVDHEMLNNLESFIE